MELSLTRLIRLPGKTLGLFSIDGTPECFILEDEDRLVRCEPKIYGQTAIPAGRYNIVLTQSNRFKRITPEFKDVPGFSGVRIHPGNIPADTDGCPLPGQIIGFDQVYNSKRAYETLFVKLQSADTSGQEIWITVS